MPSRIWKFCCSLKLAIWLASLATFILMAGSLLIPFNPSLFGSMDQFVMGDWLHLIARRNLSQTWWLYLDGALIFLFGLNTLCCFVDWLRQIRTRWRKTGEYLLHLGVVLVLLAYFWGSVAGWRLTDRQCRVGALTPLPDWPGHYLRVDSFRPVFSPSGPPLDMISEVSLLRGEDVLQQATVQINHPLLRGGLVVTPVSFTSKPTGFRVSLPGQNTIDLSPGQKLAFSDGSRLETLRFFPDARRTSDGAVRALGEQLDNPAIELKFTAADGNWWQGWYFLRERSPEELARFGLIFNVLKPIFSVYSVLTIDYDPGAPLAAVGGGLMTVGVLLALFSFYRKRRWQDRPEI